MALQCRAGPQRAADPQVQAAAQNPRQQLLLQRGEGPRRRAIIELSFRKSELLGRKERRRGKQATKQEAKGWRQPMCRGSTIKSWMDGWGDGRAGGRGGVGATGRPRVQGVLCLAWPHGGRAQWRAAQVDAHGPARQLLLGCANWAQFQASSLLLSEQAGRQGAYLRAYRPGLFAKGESRDRPSTEAMGAVGFGPQQVDHPPPHPRAEQPWCGGDCSGGGAAPAPARG